ncbi:MAG: rod-binding protein [Candidatus Sumerlaeia bacterium]|nr:rod-binding protein [Candidatus Sumerlaeia bacterium]
MGVGIGDLDLASWASQVQRARQERDLPSTAVTHGQMAQVARAFEQIMLGMMVDAMRQTVPESGLLPEAPGHGIYEQMLDHEFVRSAGEGRLSLGLAAAFERQFAALLVDEAGQSPGQTGTGLEQANLDERRTAGM